MRRFIDKNTDDTWQYNIDKYNRFEYIDIHCHCLPAIDDGPSSMEDSIALCHALVDDGITTVIATPHQLGQFDGFNNADQIRQSVSNLNEELETHKIKLTILPGGDVRLDERMCRLIEKDTVMTLADTGKYILLELPSEVLIDIEPLIVMLAKKGIQTIISHPERHSILSKQYDILPKWLDASALLQITAGSLLGDFGRTVEHNAWHFLEKGWISFVATDSHNLHGRRPRMRAAFSYICRHFSPSIAHALCFENPLRVLEGRKIKNYSMHCQKECIDAESFPKNS